MKLPKGKLKNQKKGGVRFQTLRTIYFQSTGGGGGGVGVFFGFKSRRGGGGGGGVLGFFWDYRASGVDQINFMVTQPKILQLTLPPPPSNIS